MRTGGYAHVGGGGSGFKIPKIPKMSAPKIPKIPKVDMTNVSKKGAELKTQMGRAMSKGRTKVMKRIKDRAGIKQNATGDSVGGAASDNAMLYLLMGQSAGQGISAAIDRASQRQAQEERDKREAEARFQASNYAHM